MEKLLKETWNQFQGKGVPLVVHGMNVKLFIDDFWDLDKLNTQVTTTIYKKPIARMTFAKALLNMLILTTLDKHNVINPEMDIKNLRHFVFTGSGNIDTQSEYCDFVCNYAFEESKMKIYEVTELIGNIKECFVQFAWIIDDKQMMDISIIDIFELCDADETLKDWILNGPLKRDDYSLEEVEDIKAHTLQYISKVIEEKNIQPLKSLLAAGTGLRLAQFVDCLFMIGTRPDGDMVIPNIEKESWLRGISTPESFYYESKIARDATIITKLDIKDPGAFQKHVSYLNNPNYLNPNPDYMCDTIHYVEYFVKDQEVLNKIHDRYMIVDNNIRNVKRIDKSMSELIGKTVRLRSPQTCNSKEGICRYCFGENMYFDNVKGPLDSTNNIGVVLVKKYISPEGQNFLSSKHNMITILEKVTFDHDDKISITVKNVDTIVTNGRAFIDEECEIVDVDEKIDRTYYGSFKVELNGFIYTVDCSSKVFVTDDGILHVFYVNKRKSKTYLLIKDVFNKPASFENPIATLNKLIKSPYVVGELLMKNMIFRVMPDKSKVHPDYSEEFDKSELVFSNLRTSIIQNIGVVNKLCYGEFNNILTDPENYKPAPKMNYDVLFKDRSQFKEIQAKYLEKYKKEIEGE